MFHLWKIKERAGTGALGGTEHVVVVKEVEAEVEEAAGSWLTVDENMKLRQVPASWPDE